MKFKKLAVLIGVLILLIGLAFIKNSREARREDGSHSVLSSQVVISPELNSSSVQKVILQEGENATGKIVLVKGENQAWSVESRYNAPGKNEVIEGLIKSVQSLKGEERSDSPEVLADYLLSDAQAVHVRFMGPEDSEVSHLLVSRLKPAADQNFVRVSGSNKVYASSTDLLFTLGLYDKQESLDAKRFVDLQLVKINPTQVMRLQFNDRSRTILLVKKEDPADKQSKWFFGETENATKADEGKVSRMISLISGLYGTEILDPQGTSYGFSQSSAWVTIDANKDGRPAHFELYLSQRDTRNKSYFIKVMPVASVYEVSDVNVDAIKSNLSGGFK